MGDELKRLKALVMRYAESRVQCELAYANDSPDSKLKRTGDREDATRAELETALAAAIQVVAAAELWRDRMYPGRTATSDGVRICDSSIIATVDAYRASKVLT